MVKADQRGIKQIREVHNATMATSNWKMRLYANEISSLVKYVYTNTHTHTLK